VVTRLADKYLKQSYQPGRKDGRPVVTSMYFGVNLWPKPTKKLDRQAMLAKLMGRPSELAVDDVDVAPIRTTYVRPKFPDAERIYPQSGMVWVTFTVTETGAVTNVRSPHSRPVKTGGGYELVYRLQEIGSSSHGYAGAAIGAVKQWKYKPAIKDMKPVAVKMVEQIEFVPPGSK
jgi:hypothetical protein